MRYSKCITKVSQFDILSKMDRYRMCVAHIITLIEVLTNEGITSLLPSVNVAGRILQAVSSWQKMQPLSGKLNIFLQTNFEADMTKDHGNSEVYDSIYNFFSSICKKNP